jgi:D-alanine-D-alanine ligase
MKLPGPHKLLRSQKDIIKLDKSSQINFEELKRKADLVFIAMHGPFGEDGILQGMLDFFNIKYTGCGILASAIGMDKIIFKRVMAQAKILTPRFVVLTRNESLKGIKSTLGKMPYFIKPHNQGSSVGTAVVKSKKEFDIAVHNALKYSRKVIVEEYLKGVEVTCGLIGNENPIALPLVEIVPIKGDYFNYESKYMDGGASEIVPAGISNKLTNKVQEIAKEVYKTVGCIGFSRVDFILKNRKTPYVLEVNTIPGLTPMSLFPKAAKAGGYSFSKLIKKIIEYAIDK